MQQPVAPGTSASQPEDGEDIQAAWKWPLQHFDWAPAAGGGAAPQQQIGAATALTAAAEPAAPPPPISATAETPASPAAKPPAGRPPTLLQHGPHLQDAQAVPAQANLAQQAPRHNQAYSQPDVFYSAAALFHPPQPVYNHHHYGVVPMQAMAYGPPARLPTSMEQSMHLFADSQMIQMTSCTLITVLSLLTGILLFFFVFRIGLSVRKGDVITTATSEYDIIVHEGEQGNVDVTVLLRHNPRPSRRAVARAYSPAVASESPIKIEVVAEDSSYFYTHNSQENSTTVRNHSL